MIMNKCERYITDLITQDSLKYITSSGRDGPRDFLANLFFFFNDTAPTEIYTLSLHDALPIWPTSTRPESPSRAGRSACCAASCPPDRKSTRLNSSHVEISYAVFCLKKKK